VNGLQILKFLLELALEQEQVLTSYDNFQLDASFEKVNMIKVFGG